MQEQLLKLLAGSLLLLSCSVSAPAQSINSGTITGVVTDQSGAIINRAQVRLRNAVTACESSVTTETTGEFPIQQHSPEHVRGSLPITVNVSLKVASESMSLTVEASGALVESHPSTHQDVDRSSFLKLPNFDPGGQLSMAITCSTGAVAADANGFVHPLGDHAQTTIVIDGRQNLSEKSNRSGALLELGVVAPPLDSGVRSMATLLR